MELTELNAKAIINQNNGEKMGYIVDYNVDITTGKISSIIISSSKTLPILSKSKLFAASLIEIPWNKIILIGVDYILIDA